MTHPRIYFPRCLDKNELCRISGEQRHYLKTVLRMKTGETIILFDGRGSEYEGIIRQESEDDLVVEVVSRSAAPGSNSVRITLCQSIPKAAKMDFIIQKGTELGVHRIIPFISGRSVPKISDDKAHLKIERWRKIALEACKQSRRAHLPVIDEISDFNQMIAQISGDSLKIILWEEEESRGLRQALADESGRGAEEIVIAIGPEGGFTREEIAKAAGLGFISAGLGRCILRLETAALAALTIVQYEKGVIGSLNG